MRTHRWLIALLVVAALGLTACGDDDDDDTAGNGGDDQTEFPAGSTMAKIQDAGKITVGTKFDQPLFGLKDPRTNEVEGFDVEIAKLIVDRIGSDVDIKFVETPSAIRETAIQDGTVDMVVATYTINDERKQKVAFAGPYYVAGQDIMVAADDDSIKSVDDLNGKKVCSVTGSTSIDNVREKAPDASLVEYDVYSKCAADLGNGRVDAVSTDNVILLGLVNESDGKFKLVGSPFTEEPYGIGIKKNDDDFREFINDTLEKIYDNGDWADAYKRTVGVVDDQTPEPPEVDRY